MQSIEPKIIKTNRSLAPDERLVMRLHFQEKPWDLYLVVSYTIAVAAVLLTLGRGDLLAVLLVLFIPGYVLAAALFPGSVAAGKPDIDWIERILLSCGLSIAVVPILGLAVNFAPWGLRFAPIVLTITLFTIGVGSTAYWRRMRLPPAQRLSATIELALPAWKEHSALDRSLAIVLVASLVVAVGAVSYIVLAPRPSERFTEFYVLGLGARSPDYPTTLNRSESGTVIVGIANHESASINYSVHIDFVGVRIFYNATSKSNETVEVNRSTWSIFSVTLGSGRNWTQPYTFLINYTGLWKVQFLLFKSGSLVSAYRELHLYVRVR
jgi:uncharacterized membrane protein